jgi:hypothetical protein
MRKKRKNGRARIATQRSTIGKSEMKFCEKETDLETTFNDFLIHLRLR